MLDFHRCGLESICGQDWSRRAEEPFLPDSGPLSKPQPGAIKYFMLSSNSIDSLTPWALTLNVHRGIPLKSHTISQVYTPPNQ